jgi:hypothetical protein
MGKCSDCEKTDFETFMDLRIFSVFWNNSLYIQQLD